MDAWVGAFADIAVAWIGITPFLVGIGLLAALAYVHRGKLPSLLGRVRKVGFGGAEIELATEELRQAQAKPGAPPPVSKEEAADIEARFIAAAADVAVTRILWVDDIPGNNTRERRFLRSAGATVVNVLSTDEAMDALRRDDYDIVITDRARPESTTAGLELAEKVAKTHPGLAVIGYTGSEPAQLPPYLFGMTARPGRLMRLVLAAIAARQ